MGSTGLSEGSSSSWGLWSLASLASLAIFFLDSSTSEKEQGLRRWLLSSEVQESVQADTVEVMFLYR